MRKRKLDEVHALGGSSDPKGKKKQKVETEEDEFVNLPSTTFHKLLHEGGVQFTSRGFVIRDGARLRLYLERKFAVEPKLVNSFVEVLEQQVSGAEGPELKRFLIPTLPQSAVPGAALRETNSAFDTIKIQNSLIRTLLGVQQLQTKVADLLLDKLMEFISDYNPDDSFSENVPKLILSQFRWLDKIANSEHLATKLLDTLALCPPPLQKDIISCLPEIIDDTAFPLVVERLEKLRTEDTQLTVPILDCLSNLHLPPDLLERVRQAMIDSLATARLDDLPVVVRFILQSVTPDSISTVVNALRENLNLQPSDRTSLPSPAAASSVMRSPGMFASSAVGADGESLTFEAIRSGVRFHKDITAAFLRAIRAVGSATEHKPVDLWILFIMHSVANQRKGVESLLRKKIIEGTMTTTLLQKAIMGHAEALRPYFPNLLSIAEMLLRTTDTTTRAWGSAMYKLLFLEFSAEAYHRQEVLGSLMTHVGSAGGRETCDTALDVLVNLVVTNANALRPFTVFIQGMLDYLTDLTPAQCRKIFYVFASLAFLPPATATRAAASSQLADVGESALKNDLELLIRKLVSNPSAKYKRIGIIGAANIIRLHGLTAATAARQAKTATLMQGTGTQHPSVQKQHAAHVTKLLVDTLQANCRKLPETLAFLYDELARVLAEDGQQISSVVAAHLYEMYGQELDSLAVLLAKSPSSGDDGEPNEDPPAGAIDIPTENQWCNLDGSAARVAIAIWPMITDGAAMSANGLAGRDRLRCLCSLLRMISILLKITSANDLTDIDGLLGCPLALPSAKTVANVERELPTPRAREPVVTAFFYAVNWVREVINVFATQTDVALRDKVVRRLGNLLELEEILDRLLAKCPRFTPPPLSPHNVDTLSGRPPPVLEGVSGAAGAKKGRKPNKGKSTSENLQADDTGAAEPDVSTSPLITDLSTTPRVDKLRPYFRDFDLSTALILAYSPSSDDGGDGESDMPSSTQPRPRPTATSSRRRRRHPGDAVELEMPRMHYLLEDLNTKVELLFGPERRPSPNAAAAAGHEKPPGVIRYVAAPLRAVEEILPVFGALCDHFTRVTAALKAAAEVASSAANVDTVDTANAADGNAPRPAIPRIPITADSVSNKSRTTLRCAELILRIFERVLSYEPLYTGTKETRQVLVDLYREITCAVARNPPSLPIHAPADTMSVSLAPLQTAVFDFFESQSSAVPSFAVATCLARLLAAIVAHSESDTTRTEGRADTHARLGSRLSDLALDFLGREWPTTGVDGVDFAPPATADIRTMLNLHLDSAPQPLTIIERLITNDMVALLEGTDESSGQQSGEERPPEVPTLQYKTLTKSTYTVYYRTLLEQLNKIFGVVVSQLKQHVSSAESAANDDIEDEIEAKLEKMHRCQALICKLLESATTIAFRNRNQVLAAAIRNGSDYLSVVAKEAVPALTPLLKTEPHMETIARLLKQLQENARVVNEICAKCKTERLSTALVPTCRKVIETLTYKLKEMFVANEMASSSVRVLEARARDAQSDEGEDVDEEDEGGSKEEHNSDAASGEDVEMAEAQYEEEQDEEEEEEEEEEELRRKVPTKKTATKAIPKARRTGGMSRSKQAASKRNDSPEDIEEDEEEHQQSEQEESREEIEENEPKDSRTHAKKTSAQSAESKKSRFFNPPKKFVPPAASAVKSKISKQAAERDRNMLEFLEKEHGNTAKATTPRPTQITTTSAKAAALAKKSTTSKESATTAQSSQKRKPRVVEVSDEEGEKEKEKARKKAVSILVDDEAAEGSPEEEEEEEEEEGASEDADEEEVNSEAGDDDNEESAEL